ncbi:hypothetical protein ABZP36_034524 [Zizania latifolia]
MLDCLPSSPESMDENLGKQHGVDVGEQMALDEQQTECEHLCKQHGMEVSEQHGVDAGEQHARVKKKVRCCRLHNVKTVPCFYHNPCERCGLNHCEYTISAWIHGLEYFDCITFIPDLTAHKMDGNTILLSERVLNLLDELANGKRKVAKMDDSNDVLFVVDSMSSGTEVPNSQEENKQDYSEQNVQGKEKNVVNTSYNHIA